MFSRLHLIGTDIVRKAEPRWMDGEPGSWIVMDFEDITGPTWPKNSTAFKRLPLKRSIGGRRTLWRRGDPR